MKPLRFLLDPARALGLALLGLTAPSALSGADDLTPLSDEFRSPSSRSRWLRIFQTEGWGNDPLQSFDLAGSAPGRLRLVPHTSSWYAEWRGELTYQEVSGDLVITTEVEVRNRAGTGAPGSRYSLAGIMVRAPRTMTRPSEWTPGGQDYVFLSLGAADTPGTWQHEVKTTVDSVSTLDISPGTPSAGIQVARIGRHLILLRRPPGGAWVVHRRYSRPDFPSTLQAGLTVYTDWPNCERVGATAHNVTVLTNGAALPGGGVFSGALPDLDARFEYVRYARPRIPADLTGADLSNPAAVTDARLLGFLGDGANPPSEPLRLTPVRRGAAHRIELTYPDGSRPEPHRAGKVRLETSAFLGSASTNWSASGIQPDPATGTVDLPGMTEGGSGTEIRFLRAMESP